MRTLAATAALLVLSTACLAEPNITILKVKPTTSTSGVPLHLPPKKYDYPYKGKLTIEEVTQEQLVAQCMAANMFSLGCAFPRGDNCRIILRDEKTIEAGGWTKELLIRHETAHCNGWPGDHPGKRMYPMPLDRMIETGPTSQPVLRWYSE
jgi:hypothetical protein